ncbi:MAG: FIST C-terminal domain-containing protein, partial [Candidatus Omnitrophica bacterium]|nr:FIST C-terminal domain-containing protein [Candidatus Omnitrophota bacterium]
QYLLRNPVDILEDGSIVCDEGPLQGAKVHLMISNQDSCIQAAIEAAKSIKASLGEKKPKLILVFESLASHKMTGKKTLYKIQTIRNILGSTSPIAGMCSYGEIGPFGTLNNIKDVYLHNNSILILVIT